MSPTANDLDLDTAARDLYAVLLAGGLGLACTDTGYGLVALGADAVHRIYQLKGRPAEKPCVVVGTLPVLDDITTGVAPMVRGWLAGAIERWPLAVVARQRPGSRLLAATPAEVLAQCGKAGTVATFYGVGPVISRVAALACADGHLVVGSSANRSGTGNNYTLADVPEAMRRGVDVVVLGSVSPAAAQEAGGSARRRASSILDLTTGTFLREGVAHDQIAASWRSLPRADLALAAAAPGPAPTASAG
ncbi:MAG: Sua5/YciO/YrdC/YwlC family protein [Kofleriaceae bacterium]|jgi:tRNA A37 threonylcarbamoyladenosine synthetase subunit TsaC/SUA5/YrdC|nr:Sua5/YciO/YrdC/YwlC family protein [Kofleriaceae bacterium]MBP6835839.1 Sua5/YciO/YrdC/YwlC family protein [Kofleriaceae bacterium]